MKGSGALNGKRRAIWGEVSMPGYGLYDRALGAEYILGLWEAIDKSEKRLK